MKKMTALLLCLMIALSLMAPALADETPDLAGKYYSYGYDVGFFIDYFFHFYDEVPGLGRVFYAGYAGNQIVYSGTYEVLAEARDYACWPDRATLTASEEGASAPTGNAPFTVVFYDFDGKEIDRCAMDAEHIYNDMTTLSGIGGENAVYALDTDPENSAFAKDYASEQVTSLLFLESPEDDTCTVDLKINGAYEDMMESYVSGTFSMNGDQSEIVLTPDDESEAGATITRNEDGTYTYVSTAGLEMSLAVVGGPEVVYVFKGTIGVPGMEGVNADLNCDLISDGTMTLYADFMGNKMEIDKGTYDVDMTTYSFTFHFDNAGDITSYFNESGMLFDYAATAEIFGEIQQTLTFVAE